LGKITLASFGTTSHVTGELFKMVSEASTCSTCQYRGSAPLVTDLTGGQVQTAFDNLPASIEHIRGRQAASARDDDRDTIRIAAGHSNVADVLPGFEASAWVAVGAPRNTLRKCRQAQHRSNVARRSQDQSAPLN
jgi:tripartite-type tricarboxylate transporter receptor subunit TctC